MVWGKLLDVDVDTMITLLMAPGPLPLAKSYNALWAWMVVFSKSVVLSLTRFLFLLTSSFYESLPAFCRLLGISIRFDIDNGFLAKFYPILM